MRRSLVGLVVFSLSAYFALLIWGIAIKEPENISEVRGLPTVSVRRVRVCDAEPHRDLHALPPQRAQDMLAEHLSLTIFYVVMVCLYGEVRTTWSVAHLMNAENPHMVTYLLRTTRCCGSGATLGSVLIGLTAAIRFFGLFQVAMLMLIAVIPVQPPEKDEAFSNHYIVAILMTMASLVHAIMLSIRRESVFNIFKEAGKERAVFGRWFSRIKSRPAQCPDAPNSTDQHWTLIRVLNYLNTTAMVTCAATFAYLTSYDRYNNGAIAEYFLFLCIIIDTAFQMLDINNNVLEL